MLARALLPFAAGPVLLAIWAAAFGGHPRLAGVVLAVLAVAVAAGTFRHARARTLLWRRAAWAEGGFVRRHFRGRIGPALAGAGAAIVTVPMAAAWAVQARAADWGLLATLAATLALVAGALRRWLARELAPVLVPGTAARLALFTAALPFVALAFALRLGQPLPAYADAGAPAAMLAQARAALLPPRSGPVIEVLTAFLAGDAAVLWAERALRFHPAAVLPAVLRDALAVLSLAVMTLAAAGAAPEEDG